MNLILTRYVVKPNNDDDDDEDESMGCQGVIGCDIREHSCQRDVEV